jgi:D-apionolactonase
MTNLKTRFFELKYENGAIRWIKNNGAEIVRMIYSAVRDQNWGTIEPEIMEEKIAENRKGFQVKTHIKYQKAIFILNQIIQFQETKTGWNLK